jgi:hypothetical protein
MTAPASMTLTCPYCGQTEQAPGQGSSFSNVREGTAITVMQVTYVTPGHECPGVTPPPTGTL